MPRQTQRDKFLVINLASHTSQAQAHKLVHWLLHLHIILLVVFWFVLHYLSFLITKHDFWEPYMIVISINYTSTMHMKWK